MKLLIVLVLAGYVVAHLAPAVIALAYILDRGRPKGKRK